MIDKQPLRQIETSWETSMSGFVLFPNEKLAGSHAQPADYDSWIEELGNQRSLTSLASETTLAEICGTRVAGVQKQINVINMLKQENLDNLSASRRAEIIALVGTGIAALGVILVVVGTAPVWVVAAGTTIVVAGAVAPFALSLAGALESQNPTDAVIAVTSHSAGRLSLIAGKAAFQVSLFGAALEMFSLLKAGAASAKLRQARVVLENQLSDFGTLKATYADPTKCRQQVIDEIDASVEAYKFLKLRAPIDESAAPGGIIFG